LNFDHKIKARAHKGDMRIGKTPKKLDSFCCPQCRETKADTLIKKQRIAEPGILHFLDTLLGGVKVRRTLKELIFLFLLLSIYCNLM
jgi:hypothetical protein